MPTDTAEPSDPIASLLRLDESTVGLVIGIFQPFDQRWNGEGSMPTLRVIAGPTFPRLAAIHPARWVEVLSPLRRDLRNRAAYGEGMSVAEIDAANALLDSLPPPPQEIALTATGAPTLGPAAVAVKPTSRQVNVRLGETDYEDLATAAAIAGTTPTAFARWLIVGGARRTIADHAAAYSEIRSRS